ncbi:amdA, partial [Symbiodinium sp. KB8]
MSKSPFPDFFQRGLNVTLSTDDPLMFHATKEPLLEEYTTARCIFGLKMTDMCEIAANSGAVLHVAESRSLALLRTLGAPLAARDGSGDTALGLAVRGAQLEVVEYLVLTVGISPDEQAEALACLQPSPCRFWLRRCLESKVGCHEPLGGFLDPRLGCGLPLE